MNRDIVYIIKRVIIGVLIGIILFSIKSCNVKALSNEGIFNDLNIPGSENSARWFSLNGNNSFTDKGYSFLSNNDIYYSLPSTPNFNYGNYGGALTLCNMSFVTNNYYSVTYTFVSDGYDYVHPYFSAMSNRLGIFNSINDTVFNFNILNSSTGWQITSIPGLLPIGGDVFTYTIIFKANNTGTCLSSAFTSNSKNLSATELAFVGYKYQSLGNEPLTEQQISTIINNSNQQVINNIQSSANNIINNQNTNTQQIITEQQNTTDAIEDLNDTMKDSSTDSPNSGINAVKNGLATNGVITQLITLPVTLFQQILTSINGTCQTFNLGSLLGTDLILPCINVSSYLGSTLWGIIDVIISGYLVWVIARKMISAFEMFSAMKDGDVLDD